MPVGNSLFTAFLYLATLKLFQPVQSGLQASQWSGYFESAMLNIFGKVKKGNVQRGATLENRGLSTLFSLTLFGFF